MNMATILPCVRTRLSTAVCRVVRPDSRSFASSNQLLRQGPGTGENFNQANDPNPRKLTPNVSETNETAVTSFGASDAPLQESVEDAEKQRQLQAPNRKGIWSRSQMPRELAMSGPRFEQTIMEMQPQPYAAIELIHKQPVRWVDKRMVACDGGGGPAGHPKIFINVDKPQICWCTYCGLPYAHVHHRKHLESLPSTNFPLKPQGDPMEVQMPKTPSQFGEIDGEYPHLKGEIEAQSTDGTGFAQR